MRPPIDDPMIPVCVRSCARAEAPVDLGLQRADQEVEVGIAAPAAPAAGPGTGCTRRSAAPPCSARPPRWPRRLRGPIRSRVSSTRHSPANDVVAIEQVLPVVHVDDRVVPAARLRRTAAGRRGCPGRLPSSGLWHRRQHPDVAHDLSAGGRGPRPVVPHARSLPSTPTSHPIGLPRPGQAPHAITRRPGVSWSQPSTTGAHRVPGGSADRPLHRHLREGPGVHAECRRQGCRVLLLTTDEPA